MAGDRRVRSPVLPIGTWLGLVPSALALAMVAIAEGLLLSRSYAGLSLPAASSP